MNQNKQQATERFYSFFSSIKPRQNRTTLNENQWQSHVLPHGAIEQLAPNLWHVTGTLPSSVIVPREMVVYKFPDSSLLIHSAIALNQQGMAELESLGTPKTLIVPNRIHRLDAGVYKRMALRKAEMLIN